MTLNNLGASLIEVLAAVVILIGAAALISQVLPKAARSSVNSGQHWMAQQMATSKIEDLKKQTFEYIPVTPNSQFPSGTNCDCSNPALNFSTLSSFTQTSGPTTYLVGWCINEVSRTGSALTAQCQSASPSAFSDYKNIIVRVEWPWPPASGQRGDHRLEEETLATRY